MKKIQLKVHQSGFTIVELLIVIVIIGFLATITIVVYAGISQRAHIAVLQSDLSNAVTSLGMVNAEKSAYPGSLDCTATPVVNSTCLKASPGTVYQYTYNSVDNSYCLTATNSNIAYMVSIANSTPTAGVCAGHVGPGGVVSTAPINLAATGGTNQISLTWTTPANNGDSAITCYKLYRGTTANPTTLVQTLGNVTSYTDTGLTAGTTYYYRVTAINSNGDSPYSTQASATPMATGIADNFNRTAGTLGVTSTGALPWTALSGTWSTNGTNATTTAADSSNPLATVNFGSANVDASVNVSSGGGDALYIRVTDATNWIRARVRSWTTSVQTYHPSSYYVAGSYYGTGWVYQGVNGYSSNSATTTYESYQNGIPTLMTTYDANDSYSPGWKIRYIYTQSVAQNAGYYADNSYYTTDYTTHYTVILDKSVAGVITTLGTSAELSAPTSLRLRAVGTAIDVFTNGGATAVTTATDASFTTISKHGVGRGPSDNNGQGLDNFTITAL